MESAPPCMARSPDKQTVGGAAVSFCSGPLRAYYLGLWFLGERHGISLGRLLPPTRPWMGHELRATTMRRQHAGTQIPRPLWAGDLDMFVETWLGVRGNKDGACGSWLRRIWNRFPLGKAGVYPFRPRPDQFGLPGELSRELLLLAVTRLFDQRPVHLLSDKSRTNKSGSCDQSRRHCCMSR